MNSKVLINLLATGVPGLDELLGGGFSEFSFNLIAGSPGCGKTTLAHQVMFALATPERPALFFTAMGEPPLKMLRYQQQFDFFNSEAVNRYIHFINIRDENLTESLEDLMGRIANELEKHNPSLVFVDSFRSIAFPNSVASNSINNLQEFVQRLCFLMTTYQATTFVLDENLQDTEYNSAFTIADGLIWLRQSMLRNSMVRKIEVIKMRGQASMPGLHSFRIDRTGIKVFPPILIPRPTRADSATTPPYKRLLTGVPSLDEMLAGGLPRGYSLLVAGPSGSGKSILASAFLAEGARCGETGVIAAFEQHPNKSLNHVIADLINNDQVGLVDSQAPDLSINEIVLLIITEIRRLKATRVVIDSLSGFELLIAPTFRSDFRESMARMLAALANEGVTALMTSELEDRYTDLRFSPYGTAFLTDAIIVMRYIEVDSQLLRVMAVVKVRACAHSNELREFSIGNEGIQIGEMLKDQEGLLGGRPTRKHVADLPTESVGADND